MLTQRTLHVYDYQQVLQTLCHDLHLALKKGDLALIPKCESKIAKKIHFWYCHAQAFFGEPRTKETLLDSDDRLPYRNFNANIRIILLFSLFQHSSSRYQSWINIAEQLLNNHHNISAFITIVSTLSDPWVPTQLRQKQKERIDVLSKKTMDFLKNLTKCVENACLNRTSIIGPCEVIEGEIILWSESIRRKHSQFNTKYQENLDRLRNYIQYITTSAKVECADNPLSSQEIVLFYKPLDETEIEKIGTRVRLKEYYQLLKLSLEQAIAHSIRSHELVKILENVVLHFDLIYANKISLNNLLSLCKDATNSLSELCPKLAEDTHRILIENVLVLLDKTSKFLSANSNITNVGLTDRTAAPFFEEEVQMFQLCLRFLKLLENNKITMSGDVMRSIFYFVYPYNIAANKSLFAKHVLTFWHQRYVNGKFTDKKDAMHNPEIKI